VKEGRFLAKLLGVSALVSAGIKYGLPLLALTPSLGLALGLVLAPSGILALAMVLGAPRSSTAHSSTHHPGD